jgi:IS1 family transposase
LQDALGTHPGALPLPDQLFRLLPVVVTTSPIGEAYNFIYQQTGQHQKVGKDSGQTNHMERWNNTIRQWLGRLTRKTLSFSKSDFYNQLVIRLFIIRYNLAKSV